MEDVGENELTLRVVRVVATAVVVLILGSTATCMGTEAYVKGVAIEAGLSPSGVRCVVDGYENECTLDALDDWEVEQCKTVGDLVKLVDRERA